MKNILHKLVMLFAITLLLGSCKKNDLAQNNPFVDVANLGNGAYITLNSTVNANLDFAALATSKVGIKVDAYNNGVKIKEIKMYVYKGSSANRSDWKFIKTVPLSGTTELSATGAEIATAYGVSAGALFSPGQFYTFYNQVVTEDGRTFDLANTPGALESSTNYNAAFRFTAFVVCPFTGGMTGNYTVVQDDWADWSVGDVVAVTDGPAANQINLGAVWPNPAYGDLLSPLTIQIDPLTGTAKLANTSNFADYGVIVAPYLPSSGTLGYVFSCTGYIGLKIGIKSATTDYGVYTLILQKM